MGEESQGAGHHAGPASGDDGAGSLEYLVFQRVLVPLAKKHGLHPVIDYGDADLDAVLAPPVPSSDGSALFRRFRASFPGAHPTLEVASQLNCAFVLRKGGGDAGEGARAGVKRGRDEAAAMEAEAARGAAAEAAALEAARLERVQAGYAAPQYKRSSKFKRTV